MSILTDAELVAMDSENESLRAKLEAAELERDDAQKQCADAERASNEWANKLEAAEAKIAALGKQVRQAGDSLAEAHRRREDAARKLEAATDALKQAKDRRHDHVAVYNICGEALAKIGGE